MDVQTWLSKEECVQGMGQRSHANSAAGKNALIKRKKGGFVLSMGHRRRDAAVKDAQIMLSREEYVGGMEQRSKYAAVRQVVLPGDEIIYLKHYPLSLSHNIII